MRSQTKPVASLSLDLDDKWTYMKTHGDARWSSYPSYLATVVPRVLTFLDERALKITFFIVGQDAALPGNQGILRSLSAAGHEIGNHSFRHEPWLHLYSESELQAEFEAAERAIEHATGVRPTGFRGPGFSVSETVIDVLISRGYRYDASTLPTFLGPLARAYYFFNTKLNHEEKKKRAKLYGTLRDGLRPLEPHEWQTAAGSITEVPVTTIPGLRIPFHLSYLVYLSSFSRLLAESYLRTALLACRLRGVAPSFLLHPLDFVGPGEAPEVSFFPGMGLSLERKLSVAAHALAEISKYFHLVPLHLHVAASSAEADKLSSTPASASS
ncbi:MAG TPA: polysaccharide deacetylase family protein [Bryobacteraceae bacterium]